MIKKTVGLLLLLVACQVTFSAEASLQEQIDAIKQEITEQEQLQEQLRSDLTSKDEEIASLKQQLEELEKKITE